jgi:hypothetical protein
MNGCLYPFHLNATLLHRGDHRFESYSAHRENPHRWGVLSMQTNCCKLKFPDIQALLYTVSTLGKVFYC